MTNQATWAQAIRLVLLIRGMTEEEVALSSGVTLYRISRALTGARPPSPELRDRITDAVLAERE